MRGRTDGSFEDVIVGRDEVGYLIVRTSTTMVSLKDREEEKRREEGRRKEEKKEKLASPSEADMIDLLSGVFGDLRKRTRV